MRAGLALAGVELVDLVGYDLAWLTLGVLAVHAVAGYLLAKPRQRESHQDEVSAALQQWSYWARAPTAATSSTVFTRNLAESLSHQACQLLG